MDMQNTIGVLTIIIYVAVVYWVDSHFVYKKKTTFPGHFILTRFFPRRALAYAMVIAGALAIVGSVRNTYPRDSATYELLNKVTLTLVYPLGFIMAALVLMVIKIAIIPAPADKLEP